MSDWTRLAYGTLIASALAGGTAIYFQRRSTVTTYDFAVLVDRVHELSAVAASSTSRFDVVETNNAGWGVGYSTNMPAELWSFMQFRGTDGARTAPLLAAGLPRQALSEVLRQIPDLCGKFVRAIETNSHNAGFHPVFWDQTSLWADAEIGDGTSMWTIGSSPSGAPVFGANLGSVISTTTLLEAWRALDRMTCTWFHASSWAPATAVQYRVDWPFDYWLISDVNMGWFPTNSPPDYLPEGVPPLGPDGLGQIYDLNVYGLDELSAAAPYATNTASSPRESFEFQPLDYVQYTRTYQHGFDESTTHTSNEITDTLELFNMHAVQPKLLVNRVTNYFQLGIASLPSGVVADVEVYWPARSWLTAVGEGVSTQFNRHVLVTAAQHRIVFTGLSTNVATNVAFAVSPSVADVLGIDSVQGTFGFSGSSTGTFWAWHDETFIWTNRAAFSGGVEAEAPPFGLLRWTFLDRDQAGE